MFSKTLVQKLQKSSIIAVLVIDSEEDAVLLARALLRGGITAIELTLRTQAAHGALKRILSEVPEMLAGIGTVLTVEQVQAVKDLGAAFGVAPGFNEKVVRAAQSLSLPFAPGIMTASELEAAHSLDCTVMKIFPVEPVGGLDYLVNLNNPYAHLGIKFIPLGGVSPENLQRYLESPIVLAVGGSWLAPRKLIQEKAWDEISRNCEKATEIANRVSKL